VNLRLVASGSVALAAFAWACESTGPRDALPDWSEGYDQGDTDVEPGDTDGSTPIDGFALGAPNDLPLDPRLYALGTIDPCTVTLDGTPEGYDDLECLYDIAELDLYGFGLQFDLNVPEGACDYLAYNHYMYEVWEVGYGPAEVSYTIDEDGNIIDGENSQNGDPVCEFNYSLQNPEFPNCCLGTYTETVTVIDEDGSTADTVTPNQSWEGLPSSCYGGAAFIDPEATFTIDGWPTGKLVPLDKAGYQKRFVFPYLSATFYTNVPLANYYDPDDHDGSMPAGLAADWAQPEYTFVCLDHAYEVLGKLTLVVREWNEEEEFYASGDPETTGSEPVTGLPIDDIDDLATATPGDDVWLEWGQ
jgi:hypothetical protein